MTQLLEQAFTKASELSSEEQDTIAALILREIEADQRWEEVFASSQEALSQLTDEALAEHRAGRTRLQPTRRQKRRRAAEHPKQ